MTKGRGKVSKYIYTIYYISSRYEVDTYGVSERITYKIKYLLSYTCV